MPSHNTRVIETYEYSDLVSKTKTLAPGIYTVRCRGTNGWNYDDSSQNHTYGGYATATFQLNTSTFCYAMTRSGGYGGSYSGYSSSGGNGGAAIFFYLPELSPAPIACGAGGGGQGGGGSGSSNTSGSKGSGHSGSSASSNDNSAGWTIAGSTSSTTGTWGQRANGSGGGGGAGYPGGHGGISGSFAAYKGYSTSTRYAESGGYSTTTVNGYSIRYGYAGDGESGWRENHMRTAGDGDGGAGGRNFVYTGLTSSYLVGSVTGSTSTISNTSLSIELDYITIENDIQCTESPLYVLESSCQVAIFDEEFDVYISDIAPGYTLNSVTFYGAGYNITNTLTYEDYNGEFYTTTFTIPSNGIDKTFTIVASVFENPYVTINRTHYWAIKDTIGTLALSRGIIETLDSVRTLRPDIYAATWLVEVYMYNGWEFQNCIITCDEDPEFNVVVDEFGETDALSIVPSMAGRHYVFNINENESKIPCYFQYYVYNIMRDVYYLVKTETLFGSAAGDIIQYTPEQQKGYDLVGDSTKYVTLEGHGSVLSIYFTPKVYNLTVLYGTVETSINGTGTYKGQAYYTEPVKITFNRNKYENDGEDPRDDFDHWKSEEGFNIEQHTEVITFEMPYEDLTLYPVMRSFRKNSNIFKNKYPLDAVYGDYIYNGYMNNLVYDGDVKQENHGFLVGHAIYYDQTEHKYKKALADGTEKSNVIGVVHNVNSKDTFGYQIYGHTGITKYSWRDTRSTIMYLSDKTPGQLVFYEDIENNIYVPVAIWTKYGIIMCITQGTNGFPMREYPTGNLGPECETYTAEEIQETIDAIKQNIVRSE